MNTAITPFMSISGTNIPLTSFQITNGSYGSTGRATITSSIVQLQMLGINLIALTTAQASEVEVDVFVNTSAGSTKIFGGEFISSSWDYDRGTVQIDARDWSGVLIDQKKVLVNVAQSAELAVAPLAPGANSTFSLSTQNQTLSQIVSAIANSNGLTPVLNLQNTNNPTLGALYGSDDSVYTPIPQSLWEIITQLAGDTGYEVYTTPNKQLVFGTAGAGLPTLNINYNTPLPANFLPCKNPVFTHSPRRNSTFRVLVISYDPGKAQVSLGRATAVGTDLAGLAKITAGISSGQSAVSADAVLAGAAGTVGKVPLYTFHADGLTTTQAQNKATAIANDIAKREYMAELTIDGLPSILPTQMLILSGNLDSHFTGINFFVMSYTHTFSMPGKGQSVNSGFLTKIKALNFPIAAAGAPVG